MTTTLCLFAAIVLGAALQIANGAIHDLAMIYLLVVLAAMFAAVSLSPTAWPRIGRERAFDLVSVFGLVWPAFHAFFSPPAMYLAAGANLAIHHVFAALVLVGGGLLVAKRDRLVALSGALIVVGYVGMAVWLLRASPKPFIDVWYWQEHAMSLFRHGDNPWSTTMPNIYGTTEWFAPGSSDGKRVFTGYPYPPLTLLCGLPGHLLFGDYRYAYALLVLGAGVLLFASRPSYQALLIVALFFCSPRLLFVIEQGWSEVPGIFFVGLLVFTWRRSPKLLPWVFGLLLSSKQYFILVLPLALMLLPENRSLRGRLTWGAKAVLVAAIFNAPALAWNAPAFVGSLVTFQAKQPFRPDALSFMAWTSIKGAPILPGALSWLSVVGIAVLALKKAPRTMFGFLSSTALALGLFFALSKQAFCNYYFLVIGVLFAAAVASLTPAAGGSGRVSRK